MISHFDFSKAMVLFAPALAMSAGLLVLIGWKFDLAVLLSPSSNGGAMKANTAACFVLIGWALFSSYYFNNTVNRKAFMLVTRAGKLCEFLVGAVGLLTLAEYLFDWNIGINQWLFFKPPNADSTLYPERMPPESALCFVLLATASRLNRNLNTHYQIIIMLIIGLLVWSIALATILSYFLPLTGSFGWFDYTMMTLCSGFLFALLAGVVIVDSWQKRLPFWSLNQNVSLLFACGITLLVLIGLNINRSQRLLKEINSQIVLIEEIQTTIENIAADVISSQADERGYIITGDERFLKSFVAGKADSFAKLELLLQKINLTDFPHDHQQHFLQLKAAIETQIDWHQYVINSKKTDMTEVKRNGMFIYGAKLLDNLRRTFSSVKAEHCQKIQTLKQDAETVSDTTFFITFIGTLTSLLLFLNALLKLNFVESKRKVTSEFLRTSENRYRSLLENIPIAILEIDLDGQLLAMNRAGILMMSGYKENVLNSYYLDWVHPAERGQIKELLNNACSGEIIRFEFRTNRAAKQILKSCIVPVRNKAGEIKKLIAIAEDITRNKRIEQTHIFLSQTVYQYSDECFFEALARYLSECLEMSFVCIDRLEGDGLNATTLAVYNQGRFEDNITYALKDTPCGKALGKAICSFPSDVCQFFPKDKVLKTLHAESYIGTTLWNSNAKPIGLIALIDEHPLVDKNLAEDVLKIVATRAASELERLLAEEELQKSEEKHRAILETAMDGFWVIDLKGHLQEVNEAYCRMSGYSAEELLAMQIFDLEVNEMESEIAEHIQKIITVGESRFESKHRRKDGSVFDVEISAQYRSEEGGYFVVFVHDITEHKQVETELRIAATVFEAQEGMTVTDANGTILKVNQAFTRITGYSSAEAVGQNPRILKSGRHDATFYLRLWLQLCNTGMWQGEIWNRRKNGEDYPEWLTITTVKNNQGLTTHYVGTFIDITKRKQAEEAMKEAELRATRANQAKSEFLANMSHEIRTPMNAILGFSAILSDLINEPIQKHYLNAIQVSGKTLLQLINDILDLSKIEAGKLELIYRCTTIKTVFEEVQLVFTQKILEKGLRFDLEINHNVPPYLLLDEIRLRQILLNIIGNAVKFTHEGGIFVSLNALPGSSKHHHDLILCISDTGIGIAKKQQEEIFTAFTQQKQHSKKYGGTGLGLTICKRLVEMMGGTITVSSTEGQGSCFTIQLPNIEMCETPTPLTPIQDFVFPDSRHFQPASILLVDDSEINRELIKVYLEDYPELRIVEAETGEQVLNLIQQQHFDLILMDRILPGENGDVICEKIRKVNLYSDTPIIMISASVLLVPTIQTAYNLQLNKPVNKIELLTAMQSLLPLDSKTSIYPLSPLDTNGKELTVNGDVTENRQELINLLNSDYQAQIGNLSKSGIFEINTLLAIAEQLIQIAEHYQCEPLAHWANTLKSQTKLFDIKNLTVTLNRFTEILAWLQR